MGTKEVECYEKKPYVVYRFVGFTLKEMQNMEKTLALLREGKSLILGNAKVRLRKGNHTDIITVSKT